VYEFSLPAVADVPGGGLPTAAVRRLRAAPNPCLGATTLRFELARPGSVRLEVFDVGGRRVRVIEDAPLPAGAHARSWDGRDGAGRRVAPGLYLARVTGPQGAAVARVVVAD
jgi:hypothetical protein